MSRLSEILERTKGGTFVGGLTWTDVQTYLQWLLDENAKLRGQRDALVEALEGVQKYFWSPNSPAMGEGDVQDRWRDRRKLKFKPWNLHDP